MRFFTSSKPSSTRSTPSPSLPATETFLLPAATPSVLPGWQTRADLTPLSEGHKHTDVFNRAVGSGPKLSPLSQLALWAQLEEGNAVTGTTPVQTGNEDEFPAFAAFASVDDDLCFDSSDSEDSEDTSLCHDSYLSPVKPAAVASAFTGRSFKEVLDSPPRPQVPVHLGGMTLLPLHVAAARRDIKYRPEAFMLANGNGCY